MLRPGWYETADGVLVTRKRDYDLIERLWKTIRQADTRREKQQAYDLLCAEIVRLSESNSN